MLASLLAVSKQASNLRWQEDWVGGGVVSYLHTHAYSDLINKETKRLIFFVFVNLPIKCSPMDFSQPVAFENAEIGRCPDVAPAPPPPAPEEEEEEEDKEEEEEELTLPKLPVDTVRPLPPPSVVRPD